MGGPRTIARGIDKKSNAANTVETEQLVLHKTSDSQLDILSYV